MQANKKIVIGVMAALGAGCGDSESTSTSHDELATIEGRLVEANGSASSATVVSVDDQGQMTSGASGSVEANGHFRIEGVEPGDGPFIVRIDGQAGVVGEVIVPGDIAADDEVTTMPVDSETSVEAEALVSLLAGEPDRADVDTVGLMTWIDAELAAKADSAASLGAAYWSAQEGWLQVAGSAAGSAVIDARAALEAKLDLWTELTASVDATTDMSAQADAWQTFFESSQAKLEASLNLAYERQADAQSAAAVLFAAGLSADADAHDAAVRIGAELSAYATWASQSEAVAGSSAEAAINARLEAAYDRFFDALAEADDAEAMGEAWVSLSGAISGYGSGDGASSALELLVNAEASGQADAVASAIANSAEARADLEASIDAALAGSSDQRAEGVAQAWLDFRADVTADIQAAIGSGSARVADFATEAATQLSGHLSVVFDLDLIGEISAGIAIVGSIGADLGASVSGAVATLLSIDAGGTIHTVAEGTVSGGMYHFEGVTEIGGSLFVELRNASTEVVGAVSLDAITTTEGTAEGATITGETTVEVEVLLERVADGERPSAIDMGYLETMIDANVAAAVDGAGDLAAVVDASIAAEAILEGANESSARAQAEAAVAFSIAIDMASEASDDLETAADARAHIEAALALEAGVLAVADGSSFASYESDIKAAVSVFIDATADASSQVEADAAASAFVDAMLGFSSVGSESDGLLGDLSTSLGLDVVAQGTLQTAITATFAATATFEASVSAAFSAASSGDGDFDAQGFATAWATARATLDAALDVSLALQSVTMSSADREVMSTLVTQLAIGFHGDFDGSFSD